MIFRPTPDPAGSPLKPNSDERLGRRSRLASIALVLVALVISAFAVLSSQETSIEASQAAKVNHTSDQFEEAALAVVEEQAQGRSYQLQPGRAGRSRHRAAAANLVAALQEIGHEENTGYGNIVIQVLSQHQKYLIAINHVFAAVDEGDLAGARQVTRDEVDPVFTRMRSTIVEAAADTHEKATEELANLQRLESLNRKLTPLVFLVGLLLSVVLVQITHGHRRLLALERATAVHASLHDALTGLPNRTALSDRFGQALRADSRNGTSTGLLLVDLDRFKEINDTFGHHYGDELLIKVGARLDGVVRNADTVARLGGDEFAVLLPDVGNLDDAMTVAATLRAALETPFELRGVDLGVEASVGVVLSRLHGHDADVLLQRADIAMYTAKAQNLGVATYTPDADGHTAMKVGLLGEMRRALERDEFILHYQPQVNIGNGDVVGVEALVRWQHPNRGLVFPDEFIPLAENTGLIGPLTLRVLDIALKQARRWDDAGRPLTVSVNLSVRNLLDAGLADHVEALLEEHGVDPEMLQLEVTETAIMNEPGRAQKVLKQLTSLGIRISIDDFGAGYTSLSQLRNLPVSELKIDRTFVMTMTVDPGNALIVQSIVDLGTKLGFTLVAEGVETEQALTALSGLGCHVAQGYHFSRPITAKAFDTWCTGRRIAPKLRAACPLHELPSSPTVLIS